MLPGRAEESEHALPDARAWLVRRFIIATGASFALLHLLPLVWRSKQLWGVHSLAFVPWSLTGLLVVITIAALLAARGASGFGVRLSRSVAIVVWTALALAALWTFRSATLLYGDGLPIVSSLVRGDPLPIHEPLAGAAARLVFSIHPGNGAFLRAWQSAAIVSCAAGALYGAGSWWMASELARTAGAGVSRVAFLLMIVQGFCALFFGYVEYYALPMASVPAFVACCLRHLRTASRGTLAAAAGILGVGIMSHLSSIILAPALLILPFLVSHPANLARGATRAAACLVVVGAATAIASLLAGGTVGSGAQALFTAVASLLGEVHERPTVSEWLNAQALVGPVSAPFAIGMHLLIGRPRNRTGWYAVALGAGPLLAGLLASRSNLGYARNWDLIALFTPAIAASAVLRMSEHGFPRPLRNAALVLALLSAAHTASWVLLLSDEGATLARFATLPLPGGQAESTIGYWQALRGRPSEARFWLERAIALDSTNVRAQLALGRLFVQSGAHGDGFRRFAAAARLRPDLHAPAAGAALAALDGHAPDAARLLLRELASADTGLAAPRDVLGLLGRIEFSDRNGLPAEAIAARDELARYRDH